jgi:hypothetical protein
MTEFFDPIPVWFVFVVLLVALPIGVLITLPSAWADRFMRGIKQMFDK